MSENTEKKKIELEVNFEGNELEKYIAQQLLNSKLKDFFKEHFEKTLNGYLNSYYDNPLKNFCHQVIQNHIRELLKQTKYKEMIQTRMNEFFTDEIISKIIEEGTNTLIKKFDDAYN